MKNLTKVALTVLATAIGVTAFSSSASAQFNVDATVDVDVNVTGDSAAAFAATFSFDDGEITSSAVSGAIGEYSAAAMAVNGYRLTEFGVEGLGLAINVPAGEEGLVITEGADINITGVTYRDLASVNFAAAVGSGGALELSGSPVLEQNNPLGGFSGLDITDIEITTGEDLGGLGDFGGLE